jgi:hypothetical protein
VWQLLFNISEFDYLDWVEGPRLCNRWGVTGIVYASGATSHIECCVVPAGVTVLLGLHNPPSSWTSTWTPPMSRGTIAPCVDFLLRYGSSDDLCLSPNIIPKSKVRLCIYNLIFELSLLFPRLACSLHLKVIMQYRYDYYSSSIPVDSIILGILLGKSCYNCHPYACGYICLA